MGNSIDPVIALAYKNPVIQDPNQSLAQALQVRSLAGQVQQQPAQAQALNLENQQRAVQLQQQQLDLDDQKKLRQAFIDSNGDLDKYQQSAIQAGVSPKNLMAVSQSILEQRQHLATLGETQLKVQQGHAQAWGNEAQGLLSITDPAQRAVQYPLAIDRLVKAGTLTPAEAQQMRQGPVPTDQDLQGHIAAAGMLDKEAERAKNAQQLQHNLAMAPLEERSAAANATDAELKAGDQQKADLAQQLAGAKTAGDYQRILDNAPHKVATQFDDMTGKDPGSPLTADDQRAIRRKGMTVEQQVMDDYRKSTQVVRQQRADLEAKRVAMEQNNQGRQRSGEVVQANSEILSLQKQEDALNRQRMQLGSAITDGQRWLRATPDQQKTMPTPRYVGPNGESKPLKAEADAQGNTPESVLNDMISRYQGTGPTLKQVIQNKYGQYGRLGVQPSIPLGQVHQAIDDGDAKLLGTATTPGSGQVPAAAAAQQHLESLPKPVAQPGGGNAAPVQPTNPEPGRSFTPPPASILTKVPEGSSFTGPDGGKWKKLNGQAVPQ